jgi:hypothetical protein
VEKVGIMDLLHQEMEFLEDQVEVEQILELLQQVDQEIHLQYHLLKEILLVLVEIIQHLVEAVLVEWVEMVLLQDQVELAVLVLQSQ